MGLDSVLKWNNGSEYTGNLPPHIVELLQNDNDINWIPSFSISSSGYRADFRGKAYAQVIKHLTGYSLYNDLHTTELKIMHDKLKLLEHYWNDDHEYKTVNEAFELGEDNLRSWIDMLTDIYVPSPIELKGLTALFKICYENDLQLYASY
jgi:hypothetical protein